jgi:hypothetical protein
MRTPRFFILPLALALFACNGPKDAAPQAAQDTGAAPQDDAAAPAADKAPPKDAVPSPSPPPPPAAAWTADVKEMRFPTTPAAGKVRGRPFALQSSDLSRLRGRFLTLRQGDEFNPELEVKILLSAAKDDSFAGKTYEIAPGAEPPVPPVSVSWREQERRFPEPVLFTAKYALRLEFGQEADGKLPGRVYLCLPDESQSFVAGTFTAEVEPDLAKPPRPDELPCVAGRVALKARGELSVITGFIGLTAEGAPVSNLTGTTVSPGVETAVSSVTYPPQRSTLANDAEAGCLCRHARLAPGRYLVFVGTGERYIDWRWVEVRDKAPLALDFTLEPEVAGAVAVVPPAGAKGEVRLVPLDEAGKLPDVKEALGMLSLALPTKVDAKDGRVLLDGLRPGRYRVGAGTAEKDVTVKAGETVTADLSAP